MHELDQRALSLEVSKTQILLHRRPKTDFWRKTFYGYTSDNGRSFPLAAEGDFRF